MIHESTEEEESFGPHGPDLFVEHSKEMEQEFYEADTPQPSARKFPIEDPPAMHVNEAIEDLIHVKTCCKRM